MGKGLAAGGALALLAACAAAAPAATPSWDLVYLNWTGRSAAALEIDFAQRRERDDSPPPPEIQAGFPVERSVPRVDFESDDRAIAILRWRFTLRAPVASGATLSFAIAARRVTLAEGVTARWLDERGSEIDRTRTGSLMDRIGVTRSPPPGVDGLHFEYADRVAGAWIESGRGVARFARGEADASPHAVLLERAVLPVHVSFDFVEAGVAGPRTGRRWWTRDGVRVGAIWCGS